MAQLVMDFPDVKRYKATFKDTIKGADVIFIFEMFYLYYIVFHLLLLNVCHQFCLKGSVRYKKYQPQEFHGAVVAINYKKVTMYFFFVTILRGGGV